MHYKIRERFLDIKYFFHYKKHFFISIGLFLAFISIIFSLSSPLASQSHKQQPIEKDSSLDLKGKYKKPSLSQSVNNLLYPFFLRDMEESEDFLITDGNDSIVEYDGYFKRIEFQTHVIRSRDTLSKIARRYHSNIDTIISFNKIKGPKSLRMGAVLLIPTVKGILHTVKSRETLSKIALRYKKYKVRVKDIVFINEIVNNRITRGERLFIPGAKLPKESPLRKLQNVFARPVSGKLVSGVGGRYHPVYRRYKFHSGLDIRARYGAPVKATRNGKVTFAGWRGGYGKLIIIDHGRGLSTYYGHLSRILVRRGMRINRKRLIGKVGSTGISTGPHLHFEVRKHGKPQKILGRFKGLKGRKGGWWKSK